MPLIKNVLKPLAESVLIPLGLTAVLAAADAEIFRKIIGLGTPPLHLEKWLLLITTKGEIDDTTKIVKSFEESGWLIKRGSETDFFYEWILKSWWWKRSID